MEKLLNKLFDTLDNWRNLPAYQLERRADVFFAIYLDEIIKGKFNDHIEFIIPEFPVRRGTVYTTKEVSNPNRSFKIDYVAINNTSKNVYLIELKTDDNSRRDEQDQDLERAKNANITNLINGILAIYKATKSKKKYNNLLSLLEKIGWIDLNNLKNISQDYNISIVYIQPNSDNSNKNIISFDDIQDYLSDKQDRLTIRFLQSLNKWKINPNL